MGCGANSQLDEVNMPEKWMEFLVDFPRGKLPIAVSRRQFFSAIISELEGMNRVSEGGQALKLADLGDLPDERLKGVIPLISPDCEVWVDKGFIYTYSRSKERPIKLFPEDSQIRFVLDLFNGTHTLSEISHRLVKKSGWESDQAFAFVRGVFLSLVFVRICFPVNQLNEL